MTARDVTLSTLRHYTSAQRASLLHLEGAHPILPASRPVLARGRLITLLAGPTILSTSQVCSRLQYLIGSLDRIARSNASRTYTKPPGEWLTTSFPLACLQGCSKVRKAHHQHYACHP
jgi:hypothetical protein